MCSQCDSSKNCKKCGAHYKLDESNKCIEKDPNCESYEDDYNDICSTCKEGYSLVKEDDETFLCLSDSDNHFYSPDNDDIDYPYRRRCHNGVYNCLTCESKTKCTKCFESDDYKLVDDGSICGLLSSKTFYWDETLDQYKSCSYKDAECSKCQLNNNNNFECLECADGSAFFHEGTDVVECIPLTDKILSKYYTEDEGKNYYPCNNGVEYCDTCESKEKCLTCISPYTVVNNNDLCINLEGKKYYQDPDNNNYYFLCETSSSLINCETCDSKIKCNSCKPNFVLEQSDICISDSFVTEQLYFLNSDINKYVSCSSAISNCLKCTSNINCISCINNFATIGNDYSQCQDLSTKKYYLDSDTNLYQPCSNKITNCDTCSINNNNFICETCEINYAVKHNEDNSIECSLKTELDNNNDYYSDDLGNNYYSCSNPLYNTVLNCKECENKNTCSQCKVGYNLVNNNKACYLQSDIDNKIVYYNSNLGIYTPCNKLISLCHKCDDQITCTECEEGGKMGISNSCVSNALIDNNYYFKDETTNKYVSCSIIDNCLACTSRTVCTKCKEGFNVDNNNICQVNPEDDNKLSKGAIAGIVIGCLGFLFLVALFVYFLIKNNKNKEKIETIESEEKADVKEEPQQINEERRKSSRRSIHNVIVFK